MDIYDWIKTGENYEIVKNWFKIRNISTNISYSSIDLVNLLFIEYEKNNKKSLIIIEKNKVSYVKDIEPIIDDLKPFILSMIRDDRINNIIQ